MAGIHSADSSKELAIARQILNYIMSPSNANIALPFMYRIDAQALDLPKYDEIVRFPMWLEKSQFSVSLVYLNSVTFPTSHCAYFGH